MRGQRELAAAVKWINRDNPTAARGLRRAVYAAAVQIGEHPMIGQTRTELAREAYRFLTVPGFPYVLVYNAERKPPLIVRVLHGARDLPEALSGL